MDFRPQGKDNSTHQQIHKKQYITLLLLNGHILDTNNHDKENE